MDVYVFADEAGNFDFSERTGASRYFALATITLRDCAIGNDLLALRRELAWRGEHLTTEFHASDDPQSVRNEVFALIAAADFRIDATILDKRLAFSHLRDERSLYKMAWYLHFKHVAPQIVTTQDRLMVVAAGVGVKKQRKSFRNAVDDVVEQVAICRSHQVAAWPANNDPCLQIADYCTWAIQRKWERGDTRSYETIVDKIHTEFSPW